jgi:hypothetical protein
VTYAAIATVSFAAGAVAGAFALAFWWGRNLRRARRGGVLNDFSRKRVGG